VSDKSATPCRHCHRSQAARKRRGLCNSCYERPGVREQYPPLKWTQPIRGGSKTLAELDALGERAAAGLPVIPGRRPYDGPAGRRVRMGDYAESA
jgi:hypothetical protein